MFVDEAEIKVKGGKGGNGASSFRREKFVAAGGPDGGDGGRGGAVIFKVDEGLNNLLKFREQKIFAADSGENGGSKKQMGKDGEDLVVKVPPGTIVKDKKTDKIIADLTEAEEEIVVAKGGRGGKGNTRFKSSTRQAPRISENGEPGEVKELKLELKLLADVSLVGFPSVGKSTLISHMSAAKPKIAAYHFTTLEPNLGVVKTDDYNSFVVADVPGLIEGAHKGVGLGDDFLRHIERTKVIAHVVDIAGLEGRDPVKDLEKINYELKQFNAELLERDQVIVANKIDLINEEELTKKVEELEEMGYQVFPVSAATGAGVEELVNELSDLVKAAPEYYFDSKEDESEVVFTGPQPESEEEKGFEINREGNVFKVTGPEIKRKVEMADFSSDEGLYYFIKVMEKMGVEKALEDAGIEEGMTVNIEGLEFEYQKD